MTSATTSFRITPLAPFGIEVDIDLKVPMNSADQHAFRELFFQHYLVVIRNQRLTIEEQVRVMATLGKVLEAKGEYRTISSDGNLGAQALGNRNGRYNTTRQPYCPRSAGPRSCRIHKPAIPSCMSALCRLRESRGYRR